MALLPLLVVSLWIVETTLKSFGIILHPFFSKPVMLRAIVVGPGLR
jgi:hypothetical protein